MSEKKGKLSETVKINGKEYRRTKLLRYNLIGKSKAFFEVSEQYQIKKILGTGAYGIVALAWDTVRKKNVAIKKMFNTFAQGHEYQKRILREVKIMLHCKDHANIVNILDLIAPQSYEKFNDIYIVMDCMDLDMRKLTKSRTIFSKENVQYFLYQILCGLYFVHTAGIIHRDLKPSNILMNKDMDVRICDFGLSRGLDVEKDPHMSTLYVVTRWYRSPELCMGWDESNKSLDVWSVGCIFGELLQKPKRRPIFPGTSTLSQLKLVLKSLGVQKEEDIKGVMNAKKFVKKISKGDRIDWEKDSRFSHFKHPQAFDLLNRMLEFNPHKRITVEDALRHPFLEGMYDEDEIIKCDKFTFRYKKPEKKDKDHIKKILYDTIMGYNKNKGIGGDSILLDGEVDLNI